MWSEFLKYKKSIVYLGLFLLLITVDQYTKFTALQSFATESNTGISFGLLSFVNPVLLTVFQLLIMLFLFFTIKSYWKEHMIIASIFFSGAVANIIDRIMRGYVIDWIFVPFLEVKNNLADIYIGFAVFLVMLVVFREEVVPWIEKIRRR